MKIKNVFLCALIISTLFFTSCFQSKESKACDQQILEIGDVTLQSQFRIQEAEKAYNALTEKDKGNLKNYNILIDARTTYDRLVIENEASKVMKIIEAIGNVTIESGDKISRAREAFNKQSEEVKKLITNSELITEAEEKYSELKVQKVNELIDEIKIQKTGNKFHNTLKTALDAYKELNYKEQNQTNSTKLKEALSQYKQIKKSNKAKLKKEHDPVKQRSFYTSWSRPNNYMQAFVIPYISAKDNGNEVLIIEYNYHSNNWLFMNKANLVIDNKDRYEILLTNPTRNVVRPYGGIIECADLVANSNDIDMMWKIVNSKETLVRYTGSSYYDDFYVDGTMSWAIQQVLEAYDGLQDYYILFGL